MDEALVEDGGDLEEREKRIGKMTPKRVLKRVRSKSKY